MKNILEYLERTEQECAHRTAVDDDTFCLTWKELAELSRQFGSAFARRTEPGRPVAVLAEKNCFTLAAMFGAVYAGCFYVVIDPAQPVQRLREILKVLEPELVVVNDRTENLLRQTEYKGRVYLSKDGLKEAVDTELLMKIRQDIRDTDILYGIFTSGSTGMPKGIVVSHRAVIDFISHFVDTFQFMVQDRIGNQAPYKFIQTDFMPLNKNGKTDREYFRQKLR